MGQTRDRLSKVVGRLKMAHILRGYPGDPTHNGFVLGLGRDLVLLHQFHDFYPEGYTALRVADIKRVRSGAHERSWETMFRGEGLLDRVGIPYEVPLDDYRSLLAALHGGASTSSSNVRTAGRRRTTTSSSGRSSPWTTSRS